MEYKLITNSFGGTVLETPEGKYHLLYPSSGLFSKKELTKADMQRFIDSYKSINVINRPGLTHTFELILKNKCAHGLKAIVKKIDQGRVKFESKEVDFPW